MIFEQAFKIAVGVLNLKPSEFWDLTYVEFIYMIEGYTERQKQRFTEAKITAWHTANLVGAKKLPSLKEYITDKPQKQTAEQMIELAKAITMKCGGEISN